MSTRRQVALLRGINVGGKNKLPMAELRELATELGWEHVETYIQSGNLVYAATGPARAQESLLERAIQGRLGLSIPVLVRSRANWKTLLAGNPFPEASGAEPQRVLLALAKQKPGRSALAELEGRASNGERVERVGDALWFHAPNGIGNSKLTPAFMDRACGSTVTVSNWRTVLEIEERLTGK